MKVPRTLGGRVRRRLNRPAAPWLASLAVVGFVLGLSGRPVVDYTLAFLNARVNDGGNTFGSQTITFATTPNGGTSCTAGPGTTGNPQNTCASLLTLSGMVPGDFTLGHIRLNTVSGGAQTSVADWLTTSATTSSALDTTSLASGGLGLLTFRCLNGTTSASTVTTTADCNTPPGASNALYLLPVYPPATSNPCGALGDATTTDFAGNTQHTLKLAANTALSSALLSTGVSGADTTLNISGAGGPVACAGGNIVATNVSLGGPDTVAGVDVNPPCAATTRGLSAGSSDYLATIAYLPTSAPLSLESASSTLQFSWGAEQRVASSSAPCALSLNGTTDWVQVTASTSLNTANAITLEGWFKPEGSVRQPFVEYNNGTSQGVWLWQWPTFDTIQANLIDSGGTGHDVIGPAGQIAAGSWYHIAVTYDNTSGSAYLYRNGVQVATASLGAFTLKTSYDLYIGGTPSGGSSTPFNGSIDEVRVWNVARTQAQIQQNMNRSLVGNETGLVGYWRLDDGRGTTATDSSGNHNNGTFVGSPTWRPGTAP